MNYVERERLAGFRRPTAQEQQKVAEHIKRTYARSLRPIAFWNCILSVIAAMLLLNLLGLSGERSLGGNIIYGVFFLAFAAAAFLTRLSKKKGKGILKKIAGGEYQVMDCRAFDVSYNVVQMSTAGVKIVNDQGQHCGSTFLIDKGIARECEKDKSTRLLLIKCGEDFYDLLSK